jgi:RNA polymerase sigma-70 factor (ECF subfamily)
MARRDLESLPADEMEGFSLFHALRGEILSRLGNTAGARAAFEAATALARSEAEKKVLREKRARL